MNSICYYLAQLVTFIGQSLSLHKHLIASSLVFRHITVTKISSQYVWYEANYKSCVTALLGLWKFSCVIDQLLLVKTAVRILCSVLLSALQMSKLRPLSYNLASLFKLYLGIAILCEQNCTYLQVPGFVCNLIEVYAVSLHPASISVAVCHLVCLLHYFSLALVSVVFNSFFVYKYWKDKKLFMVSNIMSITSYKK